MMPENGSMRLMRKWQNFFEQRMQAVEDVIRYKQAHQMKVLDTSREQYVIEHNTAFIQREEYRDSYIEFISEMMAISRKYQRSIINRDLIGYSGTEGAFSHIAAERVFLDHRKKSYASFEDVFHAVTEREWPMESFRLKIHILVKWERYWIF